MEMIEFNDQSMLVKRMCVKSTYSQAYQDQHYSRARYGSGGVNNMLTTTMNAQWGDKWIEWWIEEWIQSEMNSEWMTGGLTLFGVRIRILRRLRIIPRILRIARFGTPLLVFEFPGPLVLSSGVCGCFGNIWEIGYSKSIIKLFSGILWVLLTYFDDTRIL